MGVAPGDRPSLADVHRAVLDLRRVKGMVVDAADPESRSVGSFFKNPMLGEEALPLGVGPGVAVRAGGQ